MVWMSPARAQVTARWRERGEGIGRVMDRFSGWGGWGVIKTKTAWGMPTPLNGLKVR